MSNVSSADKKSGCGFLNVVFGTKKFWPRRATSTGSLRGRNKGISSLNSPIKIPSAGHNSKRRRGSFDDLEARNGSQQSPYVHGGSKPPPKIPSVKEQQQIHQKNHGRKPSMNVKTVISSSRNNGVQIHVQSHGQNTCKTVPRESLGISGELEMMINEYQRNGKGGANLVRVSSGNVMVQSNLGNLRQAGGTTYAYNTKPASNTKQEYQMPGNSSYPSKNGMPQQNEGNVIEVNVSLCRALSCRMDPEELKIMGNEDYKNGRFADALALYERAIDLDPSQASYRSNKSAALTALGRLLEAVFECREAIRIQPQYHRAHHRLANLYLRLGEPEKAMYHFRQAGPEADPDMTHKAKAVVSHLKKSDDARKLKDWHTVLIESGNAISAGADSAPKIIASQAEAYLKLLRHQDADVTITNGPNFDVDQCTKFFGPAGNATLLVIRAQVDMAAGRFDAAVEAVQHAARLDPSNRDLGVVTRRVKAVSAARDHGNCLFKVERFSEACVAYGQGLEHEPYNSVLLCNRAACRFKLDQFEKAVEDCTAAVKVRPSYSKARLRRADCYAKLQKWEAAMRDYEILLQESLGDENVAKSLFEAQVNLKKQRGEDVSNMVYGNTVVKTESSEHFRDSTSWPGLSVAWFFKKPGDEKTQQLMEQLSKRYPTVIFVKVEVEDNHSLLKSEGISSLPAFKLYIKGLSVKSIPGEDHKSLECAIKECLLLTVAHT
ncbi:hypothetical protein RND81_11G223900 [Saponaria officinalis]|uniref:Thioredoxin domain-containing protein n=1 Tax=Saponaria officinalis TaxID=3572 RepID=A0AAW1HR93_SAPOF